jgi:hypothetical protein
METIAIDTLIRENEGFVPLAKSPWTRSEPQGRSIEGAIRLAIDGRRLLTEEDWDDVDALWAYLLNGVARARQGLPFRCYFPNAPREIAVTPEPGGRIRLRFGVPGSSGYAEASADGAALARAMAAGGRAFFAWLAAVAPAHPPADETLLRFLETGGPPPGTWTL